MFVEQIGRELKLIRLRKELTLESAAEILGIHKNTLSVYENNPEILKIGKLYSFLEKYNVSSDIFFKNICEYIHDNNTKKEE